jgi:hypothetical protein
MKPLLLAGGAGAPWKPKASPNAQPRVWPARTELCELVARDGMPSLVDRSGVSRSVLYELCSGTKEEPSLHVALALERTLGIDVHGWPSAFADSDDAA